MLVNLFNTQPETKNRISKFLSSSIPLEFLISGEMASCYYSGVDNRKEQFIKILVPEKRVDELLVLTNSLGFKPMFDPNNDTINLISSDAVISAFLITESDSWDFLGRSITQRIKIGELVIRSRFVDPMTLINELLYEREFSKAFSLIHSLALKIGPEKLLTNIKNVKIPFYELDKDFVAFKNSIL